VAIRQEGTDDLPLANKITYGESNGQTTQRVNIPHNPLK
jgi:hypothetical protein